MTEKEKEQTDAQSPLSHETQEIIEDMMETEAKIAKKQEQIKQNKKEMKQIEKSNLWKKSTLFRKLKRLFTNQTKHDRTMKLELLKEEYDTLRKELEETKEKLQQTLLDDRILKTTDLQKAVRHQKKEGNLPAYVRSITQQKRQHDRNYKDALQFAARTFMNEKEAYRNLVYADVLESLRIEEIPEFIVRAGLTDDPLPLTSAATFRGSLTMRMRKQQLTGPLPEMLLDHKQTAYRFMEQLNVRAPWSSSEIYSIDNLPIREGIVIKPEDGAGSRGVYLVYDLDDIIDIKHSKMLENWQALIESMQADLESGRVENDRWYMEELILENIETRAPARDVKFYCFYGKVGLILEIIRFPETRYSWWTADGDRIRTGKYDDDLFIGTGVTQAEVGMAASISTHIPAPFMRIDFLREAEGLVFGEFTPKPGNYDEFDEKTDRWMGELFLEAEERLMKDLLEGKKFMEYDKLKGHLLP
ncbi:ATP-grasp fold amidoligase family protein [Thalassobacillus hwangdonensis]|uniref:ATP-grasp fold amidoligase family protein n=1 Tax=Thalassobacillus hwangdonensis TaxID=546108 RepID=A0ABW3L4U8_9BACI